MYKFCINGDCDSGAEGEHKLKLDGHFLASGFKSFREGQCHNLHYPSVIVDKWKSLTVGTEEEDDWSENDSWMATMSASSWYSESCKPYEIRLAKEHSEEKAHTQCWTAEAGGDIKGVDLGLSSETCASWTAPAQSFEFMLKVEPAWPMCSSQGLAQREQDICISHQNISHWSGGSKGWCCKKCQETSGCKGFEWFTANVGKYKAGDCMMSSSATPNGCPNSTYKVEFYPNDL